MTECHHKAWSFKNSILSRSTNQHDSTLPFPIPFCISFRNNSNWPNLGSQPLQTIITNMLVTPSHLGTFA